MPKHCHPMLFSRKERLTQTITCFVVLVMQQGKVRG